MSADFTAPASSWPSLTNDSLTWSVLVTDGHGNELFALNSDRVLATASIGKLLLLVEAAERIATGALDASEPLIRTDADSVADSGLWQNLRSNELPTADVAALVGAVSDNLATNVLLRRIGLEALSQRARTLGLVNVALHDQVRDFRGIEDPPQLSTGNAKELVRLICAIVDADGVSEPAADLVRSWLRFNCDLSMVAAPWHLDPLAHHSADHGWLLINKTGTNTEVRGDVGVVTFDDGSARHRVNYAVLANWPVNGLDQRARALTDMGAVGRRILDYLTRPATG